jgi:hypothetical protein
MKRMESNAKRRKSEVNQKNSLDRFEWDDVITHLLDY